METERSTSRPTGRRRCAPSCCSVLIASVLFLALHVAGSTFTASLFDLELCPDVWTQREDGSFAWTPAQADEKWFSSPDKCFVRAKTIDPGVAAYQRASNAEKAAVWLNAGHDVVLAVKLLFVNTARAIAGGNETESDPPGAGAYVPEKVEQAIDALAPAQDDQTFVGVVASEKEASRRRLQIYL